MTGLSTIGFAIISFSWNPSFNCDCRKLTTSTQRYISCGSEHHDDLLLLLLYYHCHYYYHHHHDGHKCIPLFVAFFVCMSTAISNPKVRIVYFAFRSMFSSLYSLSIQSSFDFYLWGYCLQHDLGGVRWLFDNSNNTQQITLLTIIEVDNVWCIRLLCAFG